MPLEIIATTSVKPDEDCLLNVYEVGAGPHEVYLWSDQAPAAVRVIDDAGKIVFEGYVEPQDPATMPEDLEAHEAPKIPILWMDAGVYTIECTPEGQPTSVTKLRVVPARPGFEDMEPLR